MEYLRASTSPVTLACMVILSILPNMGPHWLHGLVIKGHAVQTALSHRCRLLHCFPAHMTTAKMQIRASGWQVCLATRWQTGAALGQGLMQAVSVYMQLETHSCKIAPINV